MKKLFVSIASATVCSFDAICRYLKLKIFLIYGNDVSLKQRAQYGHNWSVSLQFLRWLLLYLICSYYRLSLSFLFGNVGFPQRLPGYEKIVSFSFIASATGCSFDAICRYLKLKIFLIYGNDVSLETACPIWKQLVGQLIVSPMVVVADLLILQVEFIVFLW